MIPTASSPCWRNIVTGKHQLKTEMLGLQMLLKRMQRHILATPSEDGIQDAATEVHAFFVKYEGSLSNELRSL